MVFCCAWIVLIRPILTRRYFLNIIFFFSFHLKFSKRTELERSRETWWKSMCNSIWWNIWTFLLGIVGIVTCQMASIYSSMCSGTKISRGCWRQASTSHPRLKYIRTIMHWGILAFTGAHTPAHTDRHTTTGLQSSAVQWNLMPRL